MPANPEPVIVTDVPTGPAVGGEKSAIEPVFANTTGASPTRVAIASAIERASSSTFLHEKKPRPTGSRSVIGLRSVIRPAGMVPSVPGSWISLPHLRQVAQACG